MLTDGGAASDENAEWQQFLDSGRTRQVPSGRQGAGRLGGFVLLIPVLWIGAESARPWARFIGGISGHHQVLAVAWGAFFGALAMGGLFAPLLTRRRTRVVSGACMALFAWLIATQPYSRTHENVPLAHLYDRVAPDYVWGLVVAMGVSLICGMLAVAWWVVRIRRT